MNQNFLVFENDGEIDLRVVSTFGCSVKETTNPIGFFGTGLKYALAVCMRLNCKVWVQCGEKTLRVTVANNDIRGKSFGFVELGEQPCGFTTELGKNWKPWMAYRELYCNTFDESGGKVYETESVPAAESGKTRFVIQGHDLEQAHRGRSDYILESSPIAVLGDIEVHARPSQSYFYRGIRVMDFQQPCMFTYNQTSPMELTEDRTAKDPHNPRYKVSQAFLGHGDRSLLKKVLVSGTDSFEFALDFHGWGTKPSEEFFAVVSELQSNQATKVNSSALRLWREKGGGFVNPRRQNPTKVQAVMLERAICFCEKIGYNLRDEYPIIVVESLGGIETLACADKEQGQIFLTQMLFNQDGTKGVARALIEEYLHLKHGLQDESRGMQNHLFAKLVSLGEELNGEPI